MAELINSYMFQIINRCGVLRISGNDALINKSDQAQRDLVIQFSYNVIENLIRGLLLYRKNPLKDKNQSFKLFNLLTQI